MGKTVYSFYHPLNTEDRSITEYTQMFSTALEYTSKTAGWRVIVLKSIFDLDESMSDGVLIINWPEEIVGWGAPTSRIRDAIDHLRTNVRIPIMYIWHNNTSHSGRRAFDKLYFQIQRRAKVILSLNDYTTQLLGRRFKGKRIIKSFHPHYYSSMPDASSEGMLVYGALRGKAELCRLLVFAWLCQVNQRQVYITSYPVSGRFAYIIHRFLPHCCTVHFGRIGDEEQLAFWAKCSAVVLLRSTSHCNSGVMVKALSEGRMVYTTAIDAVKLDRYYGVQVFRNVLELAEIIRNPVRVELSPISDEDVACHLQEFRQHILSGLSFLDCSTRDLVL